MMGTRVRRSMSTMIHPRTIVRMVMVMMVTASRQHQQQRGTDNGNNQLFHVSLVLSCPHIIAHFHATGEQETPHFFLCWRDDKWIV